MPKKMNTGSKVNGAEIFEAFVEQLGESKTVDVTYNFTAKGIENIKEAKKLYEDILKLDKNKKSDYFTTQEANLRKIIKAYKEYNNAVLDIDKKKSGGELIRWINSYRARDDFDQSKLDKRVKTLETYNKIIDGLNQNQKNGFKAYSVDSFKEIFELINKLNSSGFVVDMSRFFRNFKGVDPIDSDSVKKHINEIKKEMQSIYDEKSFGEDGFRSFKPIKDKNKKDVEDMEAVKRYYELYNELKLLYSQLYKKIPEHFSDLYKDTLERTFKRQKIDEDINKRIDNLLKGKSDQNTPQSQSNVSQIDEENRVIDENTDKLKENTKEREKNNQAKKESEISSGEKPKIDNEYQRLLDEDFSTKGKREATKQLKEAYKEYEKLFINGNTREKIDRDFSFEEIKTEYKYLLSLKEAVEKGIDEKTLRKYEDEYNTQFGNVDDIKDRLNDIIPILKDYAELIEKVSSEAPLDYKFDSGESFKDFIKEVADTRDWARHVKKGIEEGSSVYSEEDLSDIEERINLVEEILKGQIEFYKELQDLKEKSKLREEYSKRTYYDFDNPIEFNEYVKELDKKIDDESISISEALEKLNNKAKELGLTFNETNEKWVKLSSSTSGNENGLSTEENISHENELMLNGQKIREGLYKCNEDIGMSEDEFIEKLKKENEEIENGNKIFQERMTFLKDGKVVGSYLGDEKSVHLRKTDVDFDYDKIIHTHPSFGNGVPSDGDIQFILDLDKNKKALKEFVLYWNNEITKIKFPENSDAYSSYIVNYKKTLGAFIELIKDQKLFTKYGQSYFSALLEENGGTYEVYDFSGNKINIPRINDEDLKIINDTKRDIANINLRGDIDAQYDEIAKKGRTLSGVFIDLSNSSEDFVVNSENLFNILKSIEEQINNGTDNAFESLRRTLKSLNAENINSILFDEDGLYYSLDNDEMLKELSEKIYQKYYLKSDENSISSAEQQINIIRKAMDSMDTRQTSGKDMFTWIQENCDETEKDLFEVSEGFEKFQAVLRGLTINSGNLVSYSDTLGLDVLNLNELTKTEKEHEMFMDEVEKIMPDGWARQDSELRKFYYGLFEEIKSGAIDATGALKKFNEEKDRLDNESPISSDEGESAKKEAKGQEKLADAYDEVTESAEKAKNAKKETDETPVSSDTGSEQNEQEKLQEVVQETREEYEKLHEEQKNSPTDNKAEETAEALNKAGSEAEELKGDLSPIVDILGEIKTNIVGIATTLGKFSDDSEVKNLVEQFKMLSDILDEIKKKTGNNILNLDLGKNTSDDKIIDTEIEQKWREKADQYSKLYDELIKKFKGNEQSLLLSINGKINQGRDSDNFLETYSKNTISALSDKEKVERLSTILGYIQKISKEAKEAKKLVDGFGQKTVAGKFNDFLKETGSENLTTKFGTIAKRIDNQRKRASENINIENLFENGEIKQDKTDLSYIVEILEQIGVLLLDIKNKDLFGDNLKEARETLDTIIGQFKELNNQKFDSLEKMFGDILSNFEKIYSISKQPIKEQSGNNVKKEDQNFDELEKTLNQVIYLLEEKNQLILKEVSIVNGSIPDEVKAFDDLARSLGKIKDILNDGIFQTDQIENLKTNLKEISKFIQSINFSNDSIEALNNIINKTDELQKLALLSSFAIGQENVGLDETANNAKKAADAKGEFTDENEKLGNKTKESTELLSEETEAFREFDVSRNSEDWKKITEEAHKYYIELGEIASIQRVIKRQVDADGNVTLNQSYKVTDVNGNSVSTDGENFSLNQKLDIVKTYKEYEKVLKKFYNLSKQKVFGNNTKELNDELRSTFYILQNIIARLKYIKSIGLNIKSLDIQAANTKSELKRTIGNEIYENSNPFKKAQESFTTYKKIVQEWKELLYKKDAGIITEAEMGRFVSLDVDAGMMKGIIDGLNQEFDCVKKLREAYDLLTSTAQESARNRVNSQVTNDMTKNVDKAQNLLDSGRVLPESREKLQKAVDQANAHLKAGIDEGNIQDAKAALGGLIQNLKEVQKVSDKASMSKLGKKVAKTMHENTGMTKELKGQFEALAKKIKDITDAGEENAEAVRNLGAEYESLVYKMELSGKTGLSLFDRFKSRTFQETLSQISAYFSFDDIRNYIGNGVQTIIELDDALVDLSKTAKMSQSQLDDFYHNESSTAIEMGVTTKEIIEQASAWSRLGYNTEEAATKMAKISSMFASISPGMDTEFAQEGLVSVMKAWDIDPDDVISEISDKINILGNNFAESNSDIISGMQRSAAALAATGTSYQEAFALFTGGQEILQDAEKMGTALRSISMRIRGYDENSSDDAPELSDELKNIKGELIDLTKTAQHTEGISIFKDGSQEEFKSLVEYLGEVSEIWDEMTDKQQNDFLQKAFAKTQAQSGAAIIKNFSQVKNALETMENSAGSSEKEMDKIKNSISYKINALRETWVEYLTETMDRKDIGNIVDSLTDFSKGVQKTADAVVPALQLIMKTASPLLSLIGGLSSAFASFNPALLPSIIGGAIYTKKSGGGLNKQFLLS